MSEPTADSGSNSLGLDLDALKINDVPESSGSQEPAKQTEGVTASAKAENAETVPTDEWPASPAADIWPASPVADDKKPEGKEKKKPYVNPERVKTGGAQRDKLSEEELVERMARIREQNEKIKQRRIDVQADEEAFKKTQEAERQKVARTKKVQENIDQAREQNARRKMEKIQAREWDSGKPTRDWKQGKKPEESDDASKPPRASIGIRGAVRGGGRGRGGRAAASPAGPPQNSAKAAEEAVPASAAVAEESAAAAS